MPLRLCCESGWLKLYFSRKFIFDCIFKLCAIITFIMLCPEVSNFQPPKVITSHKKCENLEVVANTIKMNNIYRSVIITCPDEIQTPASIEEVLLEDTEYYKISNCPLTAFLEPVFIESFVKNGGVYCLSADRNCIIQNCAAITPNGALTLHIIEFVYQTLGFEGTKRPHNFYEVIIDLKNLRHVEKLRNALSKLEQFDFYITWEPNNKDICPSSIAKYFSDKNVPVSLCTQQVKKVTPTISEIPSVYDVDIEEMVEWIGLLAHNANFSETENYISTYAPPDSENSLKSTRISVLIIKGFFTPTTLMKACQNLSEYVMARELENFWSAISIQSHEDSPWKWSVGSPAMFQSHNSSCNIFFTQSEHLLYSIGQLKYS